MKKVLIAVMLLGSGAVVCAESVDPGSTPDQYVAAAEAASGRGFPGKCGRRCALLRAFFPILGVDVQAQTLSGAVPRNRCLLAPWIDAVAFILFPTGA